jgi:hypothetical protein
MEGSIFYGKKEALLFDKEDGKILNKDKIFTKFLVDSDLPLK